MKVSGTSVILVLLFFTAVAGNAFYLAVLLAQVFILQAMRMRFLLQISHSDHLHT